MLATPRQQQRIHRSSCISAGYLQKVAHLSLSSQSSDFQAESHDASVSVNSNLDEAGAERDALQDLESELGADHRGEYLGKQPYRLVGLTFLTSIEHLSWQETSVGPRHIRHLHARLPTAN